MSPEINVTDTDTSAGKVILETQIVSLALTTVAGVSHMLVRSQMAHNISFLCESLF